MREAGDGIIVSSCIENERKKALLRKALLVTRTSSLLLRHKRNKTLPGIENAGQCSTSNWHFLISLLNISRVKQQLLTLVLKKKTMDK